MTAARRRDGNAAPPPCLGYRAVATGDNRPVASDSFPVDPSSALNARPPNDATPQVAVIGAGPAGLMAAEVLGRAGVAVDVFDAMPSVGRKFLLAGRGGLNLTHSEPLDAFVTRYGEQTDAVADWLRDFGQQATRDWAAGLGVDTFVGTSGRVFPTEMKAAPLLRAWLHRLRQPAALAESAPAAFVLIAI